MILFHHTHSRWIQDGSPNINKRGRKEGRAQLSKPSCSLANDGSRLDKKTCMCPCNLTCTCIRSKRSPPAKPTKKRTPLFSFHHHSALPKTEHASPSTHLASPPYPSLSPHTLTVPWPFQLLQKPSILVESAAAMVLACMLGWGEGKECERLSANATAALLLAPSVSFPSLSFSLSPVHTIAWMTHRRRRQWGGEVGMEEKEDWDI